MTAQNNAPLPDGLDISEYRIVKKIASGGFSIVYLAYDGEGNAVAIKEYLPSALALRAPGELTPSISKENLATFRIGLKCFFEEGRALARIAHPNVVRVQNFFRANETVYMVMSYESGGSLQEAILRRRERSLAASPATGKVPSTATGAVPLVSEAFLRKTFFQVMNGLREVHAHKLLHLDIKPANIYLRANGTPILLDFGAARQTLKTDLPKLSSRLNPRLSPMLLPMLSPMYTPGFAAPELYAKNAALGPWTDIYGIGATMYAAIVGTPPQSADQRADNDQMAAALHKLEAIYSPQLIQVIRSSLMLDPLARPQSVFALQRALLGSAPEKPELVPATGPMGPAIRPMQRFFQRLSCKLSGKFCNQLDDPSVQVTYPNS